MKHLHQISNLFEVSGPVAQSGRIIMILFYLFLMTGHTAAAHPLHLSITNISIKGKEMKISLKTYRDDWEVAYFHFYSKVIDFSDPENIDLPWLRDYLEKSFRISLAAGADQFRIEQDTIIINEENMIIEMHADMQEEPNSLYLYNTILTDIFPDQTNLVIIGYRNRETGIKFDMRKHAEEITLGKFQQDDSILIQ